MGQANASGGSVDAYKSNYQYYNDGRIKFVSDARTVGNYGESFHNFDRSFSYDHAARLTQALTGAEARGGSTADGPYKETYQSDVWGHMTNRENRIWSRSPDGFGTTYVNNRNQFPGYAYDADGNPTNEGSFDAAGRKSSYGSSRFFNPPGSFNPNSTWNPSVVTNTYDGDGQLTRQLETVGTSHWNSYFVRSTVLGGAVIFWKEVETNSYYAPGWSNTIQLAPIYAQGDRIAQSNNGNVTFEYEEPFTGRRRGVEPDPLGQEVGSYDPGPDDPGNVGQYPEQHEFGNVEDMDLGCNLNGIATSCSALARVNNENPAGWIGLFLPRFSLSHLHVDPRRTPSTFPTAHSQIHLNDVLSDVFSGTPVGSIFFPRADDLWKYINTTFLSQQPSLDEIYKTPPCNVAGYNQLSQAQKNLIGLDAYNNLSQLQRAVFVNITGALSQAGADLTGLQLSSVENDRIFFGAQSTNDFRNSIDAGTKAKPPTFNNVGWPARLFGGHDGMDSHMVRQNVAANALQVGFGKKGAFADIDLWNPQKEFGKHNDEVSYNHDHKAITPHFYLAKLLGNCK